MHLPLDDFSVRGTLKVDYAGDKYFDLLHYEFIN